jgi:hypothetical protein
MRWATCFNNALAPFQNAPPAEQGALGVVNQVIGAVMSLQGMGMANTCRSLDAAFRPGA